MPASLLEYIVEKWLSPGLLSPGFFELVVLFSFEGVHELAAEQGRVVVSGHAANVGIVGWSLGGGHGQLVPLHGMGVDQVILFDYSNPGVVNFFGL